MPEWVSKFASLTIVLRRFDELFVLWKLIGLSENFFKIFSDKSLCISNANLDWKNDNNVNSNDLRTYTKKNNTKNVLNISKSRMLDNFNNMLSKIVRDSVFERIDARGAKSKTLIDSITVQQRTRKIKAKKNFLLFKIEIKKKKFSKIFIIFISCH